MTDSNRFYVYIHRFRNRTLYVGKGTGRRAYQSTLGRHNKYWDRLAKKHGYPRVRIVRSGLKEKESLSLEMEIIASLKKKGRKLCNMTHGGDGCIGLLVSKRTRRLLSEANSGERNRMFGKSQSDEAKKKISIANKGRFIGDKSGRYKNEKITFVHENGDSFTGTQWQISKELGLSCSHVSMVVCGKKDSVKKWRLSSKSLEDTGRRGKRHGRYDHTIFTFVHDSGITESCTKNDLAIKYNLPHPSNLSSLCSGKIPSYKGWRLS